MVPGSRNQSAFHFQPEQRGRERGKEGEGKSERERERQREREKEKQGRNGGRKGGRRGGKGRGDYIRDNCFSLANYYSGQRLREGGKLSPSDKYKAAKLT